MRLYPRCGDPEPSLRRFHPWIAAPGPRDDVKMRGWRQIALADKATRSRRPAQGVRRWNVSSPCIEKVTMSFASKFIFIRSTIRMRLSS